MDKVITFRKNDGRIDFSDMQKVCICGHTLGVHAAAGDRDCFNYDKGVPNATGEDCGCKKFKPKRK